MLPSDSSHDGVSKTLMQENVHNNVGIPKKHVEMIIMWHILEDKKKSTHSLRRDKTLSGIVSVCKSLQDLKTYLSMTTPLLG